MKLFENATTDDEKKYALSRLSDADFAHWVNHGGRREAERLCPDRYKALREKEEQARLERREKCRKEDEAHARLRAAAGALLAECQSTLKWMEDCMIDKQNRGLPSRERYEAVKAAVKQATGE